MKKLISFSWALCLSLPLTLAAQTLSTPPTSETKPKPSKSIANSTAPKPPVPPAGSAKTTTKTTTNTSTTKAPATTSSVKATTAKQSAQTSKTSDKEQETEKPVAPPAPSKVQRLITEREQLVLKYDYLKTQENSFWGNASKEDLIAVVEALKAILQKDSEIILAVEQEKLEARKNAAQRTAQLEAETKKLNTQVQGDKRVVTDNIYEMKTSLVYAQNLNRRLSKQITDLREELETAEDAKFEHDAIALGFFILALGLGVYIIRLRNRVSALQHQHDEVEA
jgi:hypothetical protein